MRGKDSPATIDSSQPSPSESRRLKTTFTWILPRSIRRWQQQRLYVAGLSTTTTSIDVFLSLQPTSPTHAAAKKKDVVGVRASASPSPQTLGTESSATVTEKDSTVTRRSDPRSPPIVTESRDDGAEDKGVRNLSPPPPLSPGNVPRGGSGIPYKEECERKSTRNGACKEEEGNVGGMEEMNVKEESVIKKNGEDSLREGLVEEEKEELNEESKEEEGEEEGEEKSENVAEIKTERPLDEPDIGIFALFSFMLFLIFFFQFLLNDSKFSICCG